VLVIYSLGWLKRAWSHERNDQNAGGRWPGESLASVLPQHWCVQRTFRDALIPLTQQIMGRSTILTDKYSMVCDL